MKEVPSKNIDPVIVDIKKPDFNYSRLARLKTITVNHLLKNKKSGALKKIFLFSFGGLAFAIILSGLLVFVSFKQTKALTSKNSEEISENLIASVESLKELNPENAKNLLRKNAQNIKEFKNNLRKPPQEFLVAGLSNFVPVFKDALNLFGEISDLNLRLLAFAENFDDLQKNGFQYFRQDGKKLIRKISEVKILLKDITERVSKIQNTTSRLAEKSSFFKKMNNSLSGQYLKYVSSLYSASSALESLLGILDSKVNRHLLLIFHNPSEIRPAGGFVGSYGDLVINEGQMISLEVQDIYWPDHPMNFDLKIIPPEPLQEITQDWGARDANWFFDFPTSGRTATNFLEASKIYKDKNIIFDGVIALNIDVFETILKAVGPISLSDYKLVIDENNFLKEVQREVEAGRDKKTGENPKRILGAIAPLVIERLESLSPEIKNNLMTEIIEHVSHKDIMFAMKDEALARSLRELDLDGSVMSLPHNFWGNYLAVVNANIGGGKSDAFISQSIEGRVDVSSDGNSFVNLKVTRTHSGEKEKEWWWRADNKNYIQFFTNPGSRLIAIDGNEPIPKNNPKNYLGSGYSSNPDVSAIEKTKILLADQKAWMMRAFDKTVFAAWFRTPAGKTSSLNLRYEIPSDPDFFLSEAKPYRFVYERQSGVNTSLKFTISAPLGYRWSESNNPIFIFEKTNPLAREIIDLHLVKN